MPGRTTTTRPRSRVTGLLDHDADFLKRVAAREGQARLTTGPTPLTVEQHAKHRKTMEGVRFIKPKYANETEVNVSGIFGKWKRYCDGMKVGDWTVTLQSLTRATMEDFFLWVCERHRIKSWGTSQEYIRQFQQLYTTINGRYPNRNDIKELYKYHDRVLVPRFDLRAPNVDGKPVLNVDSLRVILVFNIAYDTSIRPLELQRLNDAGCYMIICYTGVRPAELVHNERKPPKDGSLEELFGAKAVMEADDDVNEEPDDPDSAVLCALLLKETVKRDRPKALCYEDILMMVVRHPVTGRATLAMALKFVHHKGCDNKPKPTIFFLTRSRKLLFCPLLLFVGLALFSEAFDAECLKDANSVLGAKVPAGYQCLPMRWKQSKLKTPFFRRVARDGTVSEDAAMLYSTLRDHMGHQSLDAGFEKRWTPKCGRRGAGNAANGNAPDSVRDQMLRQDPRFFTFQNAYLNQIANFHLQNAFLEEEMEDQMFRLFAHVSLTRDPRATRDMVPPEVWENLHPDPEITKLEERRAELKGGQYRFDGHDNEAEIRALTATIRSKRAQREKRIVKQYRENYFHHRPTWDLERQARGEEMEEYVEPTIDLVIPERARLAELLCYQPDDLSEEEMNKLSIEVVDLYVALCGKRETVKRKRLQPPADIEAPLTSERIKLEPELGLKLDLFPLLMGPTQCPGCIGDERQTEQERTFVYCRPTKRNDHFDDQHLEEIERAEEHGELIKCGHPQCGERKVYLQSVDHFRNHIDTVHGVTLRTSEKVRQRRARKLKLRRFRSSAS
ncbi:FluG domain-containing protein [Diaporthe sp. PMI_573]|nr:FluG domain-containing protein [Diaporthaceae sp. PMI_573]